MQVTPANNLSFSGNPVKALADVLTGGKLKRLADEIDYDGLNMTFPVLMGTMGVGVLGPRLKEAKDKYDRKEIIRRDVTTIATIGVGAVWLDKGFSKFNEWKSGYALASKPKGFDEMPWWKKAFEYLKPVRGVKPLGSAQLEAHYTDIGKYKNGIKDFCDFIDQSGGNLKKMFGGHEKSKEILITLMHDIEGGFEKADHKTVMETLKQAADSAAPAVKPEIQKLCDLFSPTCIRNGKTEYNDFLKKAKSMNSTFGFLSTFFLVPAFLGFALPFINEHSTKKEYFSENPRPERKHGHHHEHPCSKVPAGGVTFTKRMSQFCGKE